MLRHIHIHVQMLVVDFLLKGDEYLSGAFLQVEVHFLFLGDALLLLELGDVQHAAHQSAQTFCFIGNDPQVVFLALLGNSAVQNSINIAGDGGHRRLQFMGHIGHKFLTLIFTLLQGGCHVVEG